MGSSNEDIIKAIQHYQERLEKYNSNKSEDKMLNVLRKLGKLPIKTSHLETTGVGRTVNALKKLNGIVGDSAKDLVVSWKEMVLEEEKAAQDTSMETEEDVDSTYSSDNEIQTLHIEDGKENVNNQSDNESDSEEYSHKKEVSSKSKQQNYLENKTSKYKEHDKQYNLTNSSNSDEEESNKPSRKREHSTESSSDERSRHTLKKNKRDSENSSSNHKGKDKSTRAEKEKKHENKDRHKNNDDNAKSKRDSEHSNHKSEKRSKHEDKTEKASHSSKHKSSSDSHSSKKESRNKKEKDKHKSRRESSSTEKKLKESSNDEKNKSKTSHSSSSSHSKDKRNSENGVKKSPKDKVKPASKEKIINGIDSESGASFAEALGMCGPTSSQSSKKKPSSEKKPSRSSSKSKHEESSSSSKSKHEESSSSSKSKHEESSSSSSSKPIPDLLAEEPREPLNICLSNLLPEITPNYKPTPIILDPQLKKIYNDDEALSRVMSNKNQRTKVYSGNKTVGKVESLFQICVRILQEHIDALEYTGGVPYLILKPILDRATPDQLFNMEHHNPYLIEETDELWQLHCQKDFRTKKREELESWREMYMRCLDEREARLNFITANIKQSQDKSEPLRTTKMAYIDSGFVKPPRNIARKQAKNGTVTTDRKMTPTQKLSALAKPIEATEKIATLNVPSRAAERSSSAAMKPKKAPLMAKTLSFLKNRFKR